jgi:hypothetical protein
MAELRTAKAEPRVEPRRLHALRIELGNPKEGGGHIVHHEHRGGDPEYMGSGEEEGPFIFGPEDGEKLLDHVKKHAKIKGKETKHEEEDEELEDEKDSPKKSNKKHEEREEAKDEESDEDTEEENEDEGDKAAH